MGLQAMCDRGALRLPAQLSQQPDPVAFERAANEFFRGGGVSLTPAMQREGGFPQNFDWKAFDEKVELVEDDQTGLDDADYDENFLNEALAWIKLWGCGLSVVLCVVWPILSVSAGVFARDYFAFWVFVAILWGFVGTVVIVALSIYESREGLAAVVRGIMGGAAPAAPAAPAGSKGSKRGTKAMV